MAGHHRLLSVRAHLLEKAGDPAAAYEHYRRAAKSTASIAEQRYLESRASRVRERAPIPSTRSHAEVIASLDTQTCRLARPLDGRGDDDEDLPGLSFQAPAPPSTGTIAPVTIDARSLSSHAATSATSRGSAMRRSGVAALMRSMTPGLWLF